MNFYNDGIPIGLGLLKVAAEDIKPYKKFDFDLSKLSDPKLQRTLGYTGGGAALGGLVGALSSDENRTRNALIGALLGGAGGYAFDKYGHKPVADLIKAKRAR